MSPKEYLIDNCPLKTTKGHNCVKEGRGRLSREHVEIIKEVVTKGIAIDGYSMTTAPATKTEEKKQTVTRQRAGKTTGITDTPEPRYSEFEFKAYALVDGKKVKVGMRECCTTCYLKYHTTRSLTYCLCDNPTVSTVLTDGKEPTPVNIVPMGGK